MSTAKKDGPQAWTLLMVLDPGIWMDTDGLTALRGSGTAKADIARECGADYRAMKKRI